MRKESWEDGGRREADCRRLSSSSLLHQSESNFIWEGLLDENYENFVSPVCLECLEGNVFKPAMQLP